MSYNYTQNIEVALNHINLEIKEGETLGIIGTIGYYLLRYLKIGMDLALCSKYFFLKLLAEFH